MKSELDIATKITCENCKKKNVYGRSIHVKDTYGADRGYFKICFGCSRPTQEVMSRNRGIVNSPISEETYQRWLKAKKGESEE